MVQDPDLYVRSIDAVDREGPARPPGATQHIGASLATAGVDIRQGHTVPARFLMATYCSSSANALVKAPHVSCAQRKSLLVDKSKIRADGMYGVRTTVLNDALNRLACPATQALL